MHIIGKIILTGVALLLIFSGGLDFGLTTIPGIGLLTAVWGPDIKNKL
jgi:hypothetical protein